MNSRTGFFRGLRIRLFGELDPVERQLKEISRQGAGMARAAHACALALIVLFSLGSLVALAGDALSSIILGWRHGQVDVPSAISVVVSTLLVVCMDTAMLYAASMLRRLAARRADPGEMRLHQAVMAIVTVLEAATYAYMSAKYEHPNNLVVWALILARAMAAPLLSVYLSMARTIPVSTRDVLYQAELITGSGVLRHVTRLASNPEASLAELLSMYHAAGESSVSDRQRLSDLIQVAQLGEADRPLTDILPDAEHDPTFPTGGGSPIVLRELPATQTGDSRSQVALSRIPATSTVVPLQPAATTRRPSRRRSGRRFTSPEAEEAAGFALLAKYGLNKKGEPVLSRDALRSRLHVSSKRAGEIRGKWVLVQRSPHLAEPPATGELAQ
jgi:hypothetical protein